MQFQSTRDPNTIVSSSEAILRGLAPDGGLFVPTAFPKQSWKIGNPSVTRSLPRKFWLAF